MGYKTLKERLDNSMDLYGKLKLAGFVVSEMGDFSKIVNEWVKTGVAYKGEVNLVNYDKILLLNLHNKEGKHIDSMLKHIHRK